MKNEIKLFPIERFIIESISCNGKSTTELENEIGLPLKVLSSILSKMKARNFIVFTNGSWKIEGSFLERLKSQEGIGIKAEVKELIEGALENYFEHKNGENVLKLKKIKMDKIDYCALGKHFQNLEIFIKYLEEKQNTLKNDNNIENKVMVYWGSSNYKESILQTMKNLV